jgi:hypothetical protein
MEKNLKINYSAVLKARDNLVIDILSASPSAQSVAKHACGSGTIRVRSRGFSLSSWKFINLSRFEEAYAGAFPAPYPPRMENTLSKSSSISFPSVLCHVASFRFSMTVINYNYTAAFRGKDAALRSNRI